MASYEGEKAKLGRWKEFSLLILLFLSLNFFYYRSLLLSDGYLLNGDLTRAQSLEEYLKDLLPLWNEKGGYSNIIRLPKLSVYFPLFLLKPEISVAKMYFIYFTFFGVLSGISTYYLSQHILSSYSSSSRFYSVISSIAYVSSTYVIEHTLHPTIKYAFYLSPLFLLAIFRYFKTGKVRYAVLTATIWTLACSDVHWIIYGFVILLLYIFHFLLFSGIKEIRKTAIFLMTVFVSFLILNLYWILPVFVSGGTSRYGNILADEFFLFWYRNAHPLNLFAMKAQFNLLKSYGDPFFPLSILKEYLNLPLLFLTLTALLSFPLAIKKFRRITEEHSFLGVLFIFSYVLSVMPFLSISLFSFFAFKAPLHSIYAWAFRTPKFHQFLILSITALLPITGIALEKRGRTFLSLILVFSLISNYPLLTGDFNGNLKTVEIPEPLVEARNIVAESENKSIWVPHYYYGIKPFWCNYAVGDLTDDFSPVPTFDNQRFNAMILYPLITGYIKNYKSLLLANETFEIGRFLSPLNVEYLVFHNDIPRLEIDKALSRMRFQRDVEHIKDTGFVSIFRVKNVSKPVFWSKRSLCLWGGVSTYASLLNLPGFGRDSVVAYCDQAKFDPEKFDYLVLVNSSDVLGISFLQSNGKTIYPFDHTTSFSPYIKWSRGLTSDSRELSFLQERGYRTPLPPF